MDGKKRKKMRIAFLNGHEVEEVGNYDPKTGKVHFYLTNGDDVWATLADLKWEEE